MWKRVIHCTIDTKKQHWEICTSCGNYFASPPGRTNFRKAQPNRTSDQHIWFSIPFGENIFSEHQTPHTPKKYIYIYIYTIGQTYVFCRFLPASESRDWSHSIRLESPMCYANLPWYNSLFMCKNKGVRPATKSSQTRSSNLNEKDVQRYLESSTPNIIPGWFF